MQKILTVHGLNVPALGYGTWQLTGNTCIDGVRKALEIGYRHIDTAQIYENEAEVGRAIEISGLDRAEIFLTTKLWLSHLKTADVARSFSDSLHKLRTDYVDLLLIHWPNPEVKLSETLAAMKELHQKGRIKALGVSNFPVALMREAIEELGYPLFCNQVEYHALLNQDAVLDYARQNNMMVTAYSPLARGALQRHPLLENIGAKYGKSAGQVALRWLIEQPNVAAIPKAASENHMRQNFEIFDFSLSEEDNAAIDALRGNHRTVNPDFAPQWDVVV